jgi:hypothetical protein
MTYVMMYFYIKHNRFTNDKWLATQLGTTKEVIENIRFDIANKKLERKQKKAVPLFRDEYVLKESELLYTPPTYDELMKEYEAR